MIEPIDQRTKLTLLLATAAQSGLRPGAHHELRAAIAADPALRAEALNMLNGIHPATLDRDHISRWTKVTLLAALAEDKP